MKFKRYGGNPVIPRTGGTFHSIHAANPDILEFGGKILMYFRGQGKELHDQIGVACTTHDEFNGVDWDFYEQNPIIRVSENRSDFDSRHILDPGSVVMNGKVHLYYSGHSYDRPACIGLAVSSDGFEFKKHSEPVIRGAIAPEAVKKDGILYLFYQRTNSEGAFEIYCSTSMDGFEFRDERKVFGPSGVPGEFDSFSISTCRIWPEGDKYYMVYGGGDRFSDYPGAFGMAESYDLLDWRRCGDNPVFERGPAGSWDEGGIWFGTVYVHDGTRYMWYEGCGTGAGSETEESSICRNEDYGGYARFNFSQIGMALDK